MYYPNHIEDICYEQVHIEKVLVEIKKSFTEYYKLFLETESGNKISEKKMEELIKELGCTKTPKTTKSIDKTKSFRSIILEAISDFEKDRQIYLDILDEETLEEGNDDPNNFKNSTLKNSCPIIRLTLQNKRAKELDKYRIDFRLSNPKELLTVVTNITSFAKKYVDDVYNEYTYDRITTLEELGFSVLDENDYTVYGVIGGGIKSHLLYKLNPSIFPNRSREAIWALYYLTKKKTFNCAEDSEFLNINIEKSTTQQNFFYPYELFSFYAYNIYLLLKEEAEKSDAYINNEYRYVFVNSFLSFVASVHSEEINFLKSKFTEDDYGYH